MQIIESCSKKRVETHIDLAISRNKLPLKSCLHPCLGLNDFESDLVCKPVINEIVLLTINLRFMRPTQLAHITKHTVWIAMIFKNWPNYIISLEKSSTPRRLLAQRMSRSSQISKQISWKISKLTNSIVEFLNIFEMKHYPKGIIKYHNYSAPLLGQSRARQFTM